MTDNSPVLKLQDRTIQLAVWENTSDEGRAFYTTTFTKRYQDDSGEWQDGNSFSQDDLLKVSRLAGQAYDRINELKQSK